MTTLQMYSLDDRKIGAGRRIPDGHGEPDGADFVVTRNLAPSLNPGRSEFPRI